MTMVSPPDMIQPFPAARAPNRLGFANGFWKKIHWTSPKRPSQPMWRSWCGKRAPPKTLGPPLKEL